jgi:GTP-binding protein
MRNTLIDRFLVKPINKLINSSSASGIVLFSAVIIALIIANSPWANQFNEFWEHDFSFQFADLSVSKTLKHWVNDGLMAVFFFAIVGKPNVGKSSLTNALVGLERNIVTEISGTTRDSIDTRYNAFGFDMVLVDTAGIRKKGKVHEDIEFYSVMRSIRTIENCDVCLFMIDAEEGIGAQDMNIFSVIESNRKGLVVLINKWDKVEGKEANDIKKFEAMIKERLAPFTDVPILFISATTKQRIHKALELAMDVFKNRTQKIATSVLNDVMLKIIENNPPPAWKGKYIKIKYVTQLPNHAPAFVFFCNLPQYIRDSYKRFLENKLRDEFNFHGVPIRLFFRRK